MTSRFPNQFWIEIRLIPLKNLQAIDSKLKIVLDSVKDGHETEIYDAASNFETESFKKVQLSNFDLEHKFLTGIRSVQVKKGTNTADIRSITGRAVLSLPIGIEILELKVDETKESHTLPGAIIKFLKSDKGEAVLEFNQNIEHVVNVDGFNELDEQVARAGWSTDKVSQKSKFVFTGQVKRIQIVLAHHNLIKEYPVSIAGIH